MRRRIVVTGHVQGVWFRQSCREQADRLGVAGRVRNRSDGAVEIEAEGDEAAVQTLTDWARRGPDAAVVDHLTVDELAPTGETGFTVR